MATVIETSTETITTMHFEELAPWLRRHGLEVVKAIRGTWPPKLVCLPEQRKGRVSNEQQSMVG